MKNKKHKTRLIEGLPVVDATHSLNIEILPNDVKGSKKANPAECAAARACKRNFKTEVRVFMTKTYIKGRKHWVRYQTPEAITREIIAFDRGSSFEPGKYKLNAPNPGQRLGHKPTGPKHNHKKPTKERHYHYTQNVRSYSDQIK